jgi:UPF0755 protein
VTDTRLIDIGGPRTASQRRSARAAERRRKRRRRRTWVSVLIGLAVIGAAVSVAYLAIRPVIASLTESKDYPGPGTGSVSVTVKSGTITDTGKTLLDAGVIKTVQAFKDIAAQDTRAATIQPGVYLLRQQMSAAGALDVLANPANRQATTVTVKEGLRLGEVLDTLARTGKVTRADLDAAVKNPASIGLPAEAKGSVEGWLFPATYEVTPNTTATSLLSEMVTKAATELTDLGLPRTKWLPTLTMASLVQAESGSDADSPKIARVLHNRLDKGMKLQLDTTVNFALNRYRVYVSDKETTTVSPYNTYQHVGLPPGPIDSPGVASLKAVLGPTPGPWMYFLATDPTNGITEYAVTEGEFGKLVAKLRAWQKAHPNS